MVLSHRLEIIFMTENNLETVTSLSPDLSSRENITIQLEELLIAGNYDEAKLLLEPSQPVDIAGISISIAKEK